MKIENRRLVVEITTKEGTVLTVNQEDTDQPLLVEISTNSTTQPGSNSAQIDITNLSRSSRDALASAVVTDITVLNLAIGTKLGKIRKFEQRRIRAIQQRISFSTDPKEIAINRGDAYVELFMGYGDRVDLIFEGPTRWVEHSHDGTEWVTRISVDDGISRINGGIAISEYPPNTRFLDFATYLVDTLNIGRGNLTQAQLNKVFDTNISIIRGEIHILGVSRSLLDEMFNLSKGEWMIDRMQFFITKRGEPIGDERYLVDADTGLRARPQALAKDVLQVMTFPRPDIRPGRSVELRGVDNFNGTYRSESVAHAGNNRSGELGTTVLLSRQEVTTL